MGTGGLGTTGGTIGTGGFNSTGGVNASGGVIGTAGVNGMGGGVATGGVSGTGGTLTTGGVTGSGGAPGTGGRGTIMPGTMRTVQAEDYFMVHNGIVDTLHEGYTGTGYLNVDQSIDTYAWYQIDSPVNSFVAVDVRYANGSTVDRPFDVTSNGDGPQIRGAPTGSWTTWATERIFLHFNEGTNAILFASASTDGMADIDMFEITW